MMLFDDFTPEAQAEPGPLGSAIPGAHVLTVPLSARTRGVLLSLPGDACPCRMILRTRVMGAHQGYVRAFTSPDRPGTVNLLLSEFQPVGGVLRRLPRPEAIHSYALHSPEGALICTRVSFY